MKPRPLFIAASAALVISVPGVWRLSGDGHPYDVYDTISPAIAQNPIEVVVWVKPGVTPADETRMLTEIRRGLDMWQDVPTSSLAFNVVTVAHSATEPPRQPQQLLIVVGNRADLTSGSASFPYAGNPGTWFGAVADAPMDVRKVAAHEVGHAVGFHHSTVGETFPSGTYPIMNWAIAGAADQLTADDIAAVSTAYPDAARPLSSVTGTIRGRLVVASTAIPVSGVNVVAVDQASGVPAVARLSGPRLTPRGGDPEGVFELVGVPPGVYDVRYLDGHSYRGLVPGVRTPADGITADGMRMGYQADNLAPLSSPGVTVTAGAIVDLGDVGVTLAAMSFDGFHRGTLDASATFSPITSPVLPDAQVGTSYELWLHIAGGLRDISADAIGLPAGLTASASGDTRGYITGVHGNEFFRIEGTPTAAGRKTLDITLQDLTGTARRFAYNLSVGPLPADGLIARYSFEGNTHDLSGNGHDAINHGARFVRDRNGRANAALAFNGLNTYLELPDEEAFDVPEFTIVAVVGLPAARAANDWIVSKGRRFGNFTLRRLGSSGYWPGYADYTHETVGGNWSSVATDLALPVDRFVCLAVSVSGSSFRSFVDGQLVREVASPAIPRYDDRRVLVGAGGYYSLTEFLKGVIDELVVYRGVLDVAEIRHYCE